MNIDAPPATRANWRTAPHSHWAFRNVGAVVPVAAIANVPRSVIALGSAPMTFDDLVIPDGDARLDFASFLDVTATDAIVVVHDGRIVFEHYANGNSEHGPHILMSATKAVVGLVAETLAARGEIVLDAPVTSYVPEVAATAYAGATLRHLLDMRAGVVMGGAVLAAYEAAINWDDTGGPGDTLHRFFATLAAPFAPHARAFRYVSANTDLLGWAIERATGAAFAEVVGRVLWQPMGAADAAAITVDRAGAARCTGGLCATVRDMARVGQLLVDGGTSGGVEVIPAAVIDGLASGGDHTAWTTGEWGKLFTFAGKSLRYRSGWYIVDDTPAMLFAMGIHGQNLFVDRANRIVVAKLSSQANALDYRAVPLTHATFAAIRRRLLNG